MQEQINTLLENIKSEYIDFKQRHGSKDTVTGQKMIKDFDEGLGYKIGKKYIKITKENNGCVWGFVVNTDDDKKFRKGDILKAAGWNAPARNKARGNVVDGNYNICWTGPNYLR
tara:strand:- start:1051 stop:1392 length:342 start_codon:yes stop_codon:yes gene_type:complete